MLHARAGGEPLHIAHAIAAPRTHRIGVIHKAAAHNRHRFKAAMRMHRKPRNRIPVIHAVAMLAAEVIAQRAIGQLLRINSQMSIATRIVIDVIGAEQKRIDTHERARQALGVKNQGGSSHAWPFGVELDFELTNKQTINRSNNYLTFGWPMYQ